MPLTLPNPEDFTNELRRMVANQRAIQASSIETSIQLDLEDESANDGVGGSDLPVEPPAR